MTDKTSLPTMPAEAPPEAPKKSKKGWVWLLILIAAAVGAYYLWPKGTNAAGATPAPGTGPGGGKKGRGGASPVVGAKARRGNIGVYVTGPGTVTPLYTVTVKSRVDGQLMQVNYNEGDLVHKGDVLAIIDQRPYQAALDQAKGQKMRDEANLQNANVDLKRYEGLLAQNAVPEQTFATQKSLVQQLEGTVKIDQALIDSATVNLNYCTIRADITGRVGLRLVDPGNIVHASDANGLVVITQVQPITVVFPVVEDKLPEVLRRWHAGEKLRAELYDRADQKKIADAVLKTVDNQIDPTTGNIRLRAETPNENETLFPDQFVNVHLLVQEKTGVVLAPTATIQRSNASTYVYLVKPDSTVTVRQVTTGVSEGEDTEITSGLDAGDVVVLSGVDRLTEGAKVNVQIPGSSGRGAAQGQFTGQGQNPGGNPGGGSGGGRKGGHKKGQDTQGKGQ